MSPAEVDEWPAQMVADALARLAAESAWHTEQEADRRRRQAYEGTGTATLGDGFPDMEA